MAVRRLQQAIDNVQNEKNKPESKSSSSKKDLLTKGESDNVLKNVTSEKENNGSKASPSVSQQLVQYSKDRNTEKQIRKKGKWRTFLNLFKPTTITSTCEDSAPSEIAYKKPPGTKMRKFMRNLRKMFRPRNTNTHQQGNKKIEISYYEPMKSASYFHNANSFNSNASLVSNINFVRFESDTSINLSNCSTIIEFDDCTDDDEDFSDNDDSMNEDSVNQSFVGHETKINDTNNQNELWAKVSSMTEQTHRLTPLPPPVLLEFDLPLLKTNGVPKRLLRTSSRKDADDMLMKQITVEHNRATLLKQRAGAASRNSQRLQENRLVLEQELLVKQQNIEKCLETKLKKANEVKTNKLVEKQKVLQIEHDKGNTILEIRAIINPLDQPRLPPIKFPECMEVPLVIGHRKIAPKPKLTKKLKEPNGKALVDKHALARVRRKEYMEMKLRPVSRHNKRVDATRSRLQPSTSAEPNHQE